MSDFQYIYGPVPSRRLGRSLGIDLVPYKVCTYDCIYCQLGRTTEKTVHRKEYQPVAEILKELEQKLAEGLHFDYISLAGSGEPTLHSGIGRIISGIKQLTDTPVAVLTNGSLLLLDEVREALTAADLVLPSLDAGTESMFRYINRPHSGIGFEEMVEGIKSFTSEFQGGVWLEVMILGGLPGNASNIASLASCAAGIGAARIQLNTAFRPAVERYAAPVGYSRLLKLKSLFPGHIEIISDPDLDRAESDTMKQTSIHDIQELIRRRPCTAADISNGLGIHMTEALKYLDALVHQHLASAIAINGRVYYAVRGSLEQRADT